MRGRLSSTNPLAPRVPRPAVSVAFAYLTVSVVVSCALFSAKTPADVAAAAVLDAKQSNETAARACALYRAGVTLGEVTPQPEVAKACDEAYPL